MFNLIGIGQFTTVAAHWQLQFNITSLLLNPPFFFVRIGLDIIQGLLFRDAQLFRLLEERADLPGFEIFITASNVQQII